MRGSILILAMALTGCATIVKGGRTEIAVNSPTPGAEVTIKSNSGPEVYSGPAPARVKVSKSEAYLVTVAAPGFKTQKVAITKGVSGWMFGNLIWIIPIFWGVGIGIDAMSGALWTLEPEEITTTLVPEPAAPSPAPPPTATGN